MRVRSQRYDVEYSAWSSAGPVTVPDRRQRLIDFPGLPLRLSSPGTTRLVPCGLRSSAGQAVRVGVRTQVRAVTTRGSVDPVVVHRSPCGRVSITMSGIPVKVWVTLAAPAIGRYAELFREGQHASEMLFWKRLRRALATGPWWFGKVWWLVAV